MTMHNGWTKKEGGGRDENLVLSPVTFVDSQREGTAFFFLSQQREKVRGRIA